MASVLYMCSNMRLATHFVSTRKRIAAKIELNRRSSMTNGERLDIFIATTSIPTLIGFGWLIGKNNTDLNNVINVLTCSSALITACAAVLALNTWKVKAKHDAIDALITNLFEIEQAFGKYNTFMKSLFIRETIGDSPDWNRHFFSYEKIYIKIKDLIDSQSALEFGFHRYLKEEQYQRVTRLRKRILSNIIIINEHLKLHHPELFKEKFESPEGWNINVDVHSIHDKIEKDIIEYNIYLHKI